jgi:hypothetical protein
MAAHPDMLYLAFFLQQKMKKVILTIFFRNLKNIHINIILILLLILLKQERKIKIKKDK